MNTLDRRLASLEASIPAPSAEDATREAMADLLAALRRAWPPDYTRKIEVLARRIEARTMTEEDRASLAILPGRALAVMGMSAAEFVTFCWEVADSV
ncbi:MAG: hypothetical protein KGL43_02800 [Burkholderiales bacterium]|nr:hypothetical protein [Burkholderiales bacterium]MDE2395468.1 hypothetical protein [Burkholderiales bacterium]MDE2452499.1 hypothetical protein [Burkholderiales bacterium]